MSNNEAKLQDFVPKNKNKTSEIFLCICYLFVFKIKCLTKQVATAAQDISSTSNMKVLYFIYMNVCVYVYMGLWMNLTCIVSSCQWQISDCLYFIFFFFLYLEEILVCSFVVHLFLLILNSKVSWMNKFKHFNPKQT